MAIVETRLSDCYQIFIFDKFLQLGYQIRVKLTIPLQMPKCKKFRCFQVSKCLRHTFKQCLRRTFTK